MISKDEKEYRCAYKEIVTILNVFPEEIGNLIPNEKIEFYKINMDDTHVFKYDYGKEISEQNILYQTRCILANLFRDYIATEEDRVEILKEEREELNQIEQEKRKKYNPDDLFKKVNKVQKFNNEISENENNTALVEYNETFWVKFKKFVFKVLHIKYNNF